MLFLKGRDFCLTNYSGDCYHQVTEMFLSPQLPVSKVLFSVPFGGKKKKPHRALKQCIFLSCPKILTYLILWFGCRIQASISSLINAQMALTFALSSVIG